MDWQPWHKRVRHDLVKRLLWPARDRLDMGGAVRPGELVVSHLPNDEGTPVAPLDLWLALAAEAPEDHPALARFQEALAQALTAAQHDDLPGVLALEAAFDDLARALARKDK